MPQSYPYKSWKGLSTNSIVPTWSRPAINGVALPGTTDGTSFAARPIKHWRKQLIPASDSGIGGPAGIGMPMDRPGGSDYLGSARHLCSNTLTESIQRNPDMYDCVGCNPKKNIIKSAVTLLSPTYYTDTKAYLQSRCQTYDQKLSTRPIPENLYIDPISKMPVPPTDASSGSQEFFTKNCGKQCQHGRVTTIYKPNNVQYAQQGAVSSSTRLARLNYNTLNKKR